MRDITQMAMPELIYSIVAKERPDWSKEEIARFMARNKTTLSAALSGLVGVIEFCLWQDSKEKDRP